MRTALPSRPTTGSRTPSKPSCCGAAATSTPLYAGVRKVVDELVMGKLEEERPHLRPLPPAPVPE